MPDPDEIGREPASGEARHHHVTTVNVVDVVHLPDNAHNQALIAEKLIDVAGTEYSVGAGEFRAEEDTAILFGQHFPLAGVVSGYIERVSPVTGDD